MEQALRHGIERFPKVALLSRTEVFAVDVDAFIRLAVELAALIQTTELGFYERKHS